MGAVVSVLYWSLAVVVCALLTLTIRAWVRERRWEHRWLFIEADRRLYPPDSWTRMDYMRALTAHANRMRRDHPVPDTLLRDLAGL